MSRICDMCQDSTHRTTIRASIRTTTRRTASIDICDECMTAIETNTPRYTARKEAARRQLQPFQPYVPRELTDSETPDEETGS